MAVVELWMDGWMEVMEVVAAAVVWQISASISRLLDAG